MNRRRRSARALGQAGLLAALMVGTLVDGPTAGAADGGSVKLTQDGWWNRFQGRQDAEPDGSPARRVVPPLPNPPNVPADAIAASATADQADKVAAVGLDVAVSSDSVLDSLVLRLQEAPGRMDGGGGEKIVACPAIGRWAPGKNANWRDRPEFDCSFGRTEGQRAGDGTWTFDLTTLAKKWTAAAAPLPQMGVVFSVEAGAATGTPGTSPRTQVNWFSLDTGKMAADLTVRPVPRTNASAPGEDAPATTGGSAVLPDHVPPAPFGGDRAVVTPVPTTRRPPARPTTTRSTAPASTPEPTTAPPGPDETAAPPPVADLPSATLPSAAPAVSPGRVEPDNVSFWDRIPGGTPLLALVGLGLAGLVGVALSPAGRPATDGRRAGGLSRALARRQAEAPEKESP